MTQHVISDEYLELLLDPEVPQDAKRMVAHEVGKTTPTVMEESLPPETPDTVRAQMWLLRRMWRWMEMNDNPECLTYDVWTKHSEAYELVDKKIESLQEELLPGFSIERFNTWNKGDDVSTLLEQSITQRFRRE
jgi:hypothetical protein